MKKIIHFTLNGEPVEALAPVNMTMVDFLRKEMHLTGTKLKTDRPQGMNARKTFINVGHFQDYFAHFEFTPLPSCHFFKISPCLLLLLLFYHFKLIVQETNLLCFDRKKILICDEIINFFLFIY